MSAHAVATAIEEEARAFCRSRMTGRADQDLAAKDAHCKRITDLIRKLRPLIGTVEKRSFGSRGELVSLALGESAKGSLLRLKPETVSGLLVGGDPEVGHRPGSQNRLRGLLGFYSAPGASGSPRP